MASCLLQPAATFVGGLPRKSGDRQSARRPGKCAAGRKKKVPSRHWHGGRTWGRALRATTYHALRLARQDDGVDIGKPVGGELDAYPDQQQQVSMPIHIVPRKPEAGST